MIVVTGAPRTGTSLVMQTLKLLGIPVAGEPWCEAIGTPRHLNPKGFYDLPPAEVLHGIHHECFRGMAVKLFPLSLCRTSPALVSRIIVCERERSRAVRSILTLLREQTLFPAIESSPEVAEEVYDRSYDYLRTYEVHGHPRIRVAFELIVGSAALEEVESIGEFVGSEADPSDAIENIDR